MLESAAVLRQFCQLNASTTQRATRKSMCCNCDKACSSLGHLDACQTCHVTWSHTVVFGRGWQQQTGRCSSKPGQAWSIPACGLCSACCRCCTADCCSACKWSRHCITAASSASRLMPPSYLFPFNRCTLDCLAFESVRRHTSSLSGDQS